MEGVFYFSRSSEYFGYVVLDNPVDGTHTVTIQNLKDANTALEQDLVRVDENKVLEIVKRSKKSFSGVICLSSKVVLDFTPKGVPHKKFRPLCGKYPIFSVPTRKKQQSSDAYALIAFERWDKKLPVAKMVRTIGNVGNMKVEREILKYRYGIKYTKYPKHLYKSYMEDLTPDRVNLVDQNCFSIDPHGCKDIDDVLHYKEVDSTTVEVGIHIADVTSFVPTGSELDIEMYSKVETVYLDDEQINMLPVQMATNFCSLIEGQERRAFSVIIEFSRSDYSYLSVRFAKTLIINKRSLTYEEADCMVRDGSSSDLTNLYNLGKILYDKKRSSVPLFDNTPSYNIHKMVEIFMVEANVAVARKLVESCSETTILRAHKTSNQLYQNQSRVDKNVTKMANILKLNRAEYTVGSSNRSQHESLNEMFYTHFTSPIRRYVDVLVHRALYGVLKGIHQTKNPKLEQIVDHLNRKHSMVQKACRDSTHLTFIEGIENEDSVVNDIATIIGIRGRKIVLFLDSYKLVWNVSLFPKEIQESVQMDYDEDKVTLTFNNKEQTFKMFDKLDIRLVVTKKATSVNKKVLIQILKPDMVSFFMNRDQSQDL